MKEIVIKRHRENFNMMDFKVIIENGPTIPIGNGEIKKVILQSIPARMYVSQGWLKSKTITIDNHATEIVIRSDKLKSRLAPGIGGLSILIMFLSKYMFADPQVSKSMTIIGLCLILLWVVYAFIIKHDEWILVEKVDQ